MQVDGRLVGLIVRTDHGYAVDRLGFHFHECSEQRNRLMVVLYQFVQLLHINFNGYTSSFSSHI